MRRGFLVPRRAVDLPREKQSGHALCFEPSRELGRLDEVVLDGVARSQQHGILEPRQRVHEIRLHVARQRHRKAVDINLARIDPLRLEEDLVALFVGEADDLVLERRAVARPDPADLAVEQRRAIEVRSHEIAHAIVRVEQIAVDLRTLDRAREKRKRHGRRVAAFDDEPAIRHVAGEIDAVAIEPRRGSGLQAAPRESKRLQRVSQITRGRFAGAAGLMLLRSDVDEAVQERPGRDHERLAAVCVAVLERQPGDACVLDENPAGPANQPLDVRLGFERGLHPLAVDFLVRLCPRRPHGGAAAAIEQLELNPGRVDRAAHEAAERIDLADQVTLRGPADGRVARHVRDGVLRQRAEPHVRAQARRGVRRLAPRVPRTDDDHVEAVFHVGYRTFLLRVCFVPFVSSWLG